MAESTGPTVLQVSLVPKGKYQLKNACSEEMFKSLVEHLSSRSAKAESATKSLHDRKVPSLRRSAAPATTPVGGDWGQSGVGLTVRFFVAKRDTVLLSSVLLNRYSCLTHATSRQFSLNVAASTADIIGGQEFTHSWNQVRWTFMEQSTSSSCTAYRELVTPQSD